MTDILYGKRPEDLEELRRFLKEEDWLDLRGKNLVMHAVRQYINHIDKIPPFKRPQLIQPHFKPVGPPTRHIREGENPSKRD